MNQTRAAAVVLAFASIMCAAGQQAKSRRPLLPTGHLSEGRSMGSARGGETATILPDFKVLIAGGKQERGTVLSSTEIYDPTTETFSAGAKMLYPREGHIAAPLGDSKVIIAGGVTRDGSALSSSEDYDFETGNFTLRGDMHAKRVRPTATVLRDGRVLVTGGSDGRTALSSAEAYDVLTGRWNLVRKMSVPRMEQSATLLSDGRVLIVGGVNGQHAVLASAEIFDPATNKFSAAGKLNQARCLHTTVLLSNGRVLIAGGASDASGKTALDSMELFDPASQTFAPAGKLTESRIKLPDGMLLLDGRALIVGGAASAEVYEAKSGEARAVSGVLDKARYFPAEIQLMDGSARLFGGYDTSGISTSKTWIYRP